jgi:hypothetical protein
MFQILNQVKCTGIFVFVDPEGAILASIRQKEEGQEEKCPPGYFLLLLFSNRDKFEVSLLFPSEK